MKSREYHLRDDHVRTLGFASYQAYLDSPIWRVIRALVMKRAKSVCESCGINRAVQVHHESYALRVLLGHHLKRLVAVCDMCHEMAHESEFQPMVPAVHPRDTDAAREQRRYRKVGALGQPRDMTPVLRQRE